jgi:hypothetical protein
MRRSRLLPAFALVLPAACGGPPHPADRPLEDLAAKPAEVRAKVEQAQAGHLDELKRQESDAIEPTPDAGPQR